MSNYIKVSNKINGDVIEENNIYYARQKAVGFYSDEVDASIAIVAYNRLDATKRCIESVLEYTKDVNYKLILVYNESKQGEGILEYFHSIDFANKIIIHIENNVGAPFAYQQLMKYIEGKYFVHLPNDLIVTKNWLSNLIKCAESDVKIGMVNPVTSNVSNMQCVDIKYSGYEDMQKKAAEYNVSDPTKWQERLRLITLGTLLKRECLEAIGNIFDTGFFHDFGDDDLSFRVRRAGYKCILATDTWIHHDHDVFNLENKDPEEFQKSLNIGRSNFTEKYYGIDAWNDVGNFVFPYISSYINCPNDIEKVKILGIDVKCGTPILDIKNAIRQYGVFNPEASVFTRESKYYMDLKTVCDGKVVCDRTEFIFNSFQNECFDYIIIDECINNYFEPEKVVSDAYSLLKSGGQMFIKLKNTYNVFTLLKLLGHNIDYSESSIHVTPESFLKKLYDIGIKTDIINSISYSLNNDVCTYVLNLIRQNNLSDDSDNIVSKKLFIDIYWMKINK